MADMKIRITPDLFYYPDVVVTCDAHGDGRRRAVFHAIHNFRSGVSDVRRSSTLKPSRAISSRSVR